MVTKTTLQTYNLSYKTRDLLKDFGNKISQCININPALNRAIDVYSRNDKAVAMENPKIFKNYSCGTKLHIERFFV